MKSFNEMFDSVFGTDSIVDRTKEVSKENKRLAEKRESCKKPDSLIIDKNKKASATTKI